MRKLLKAGLLAGLAMAFVHSPGRAVDPARVNRAIDKGVAALRDMQAADGTWRYQDIGATALAGLTLLECGAAADDKDVRRAANAVRRASIPLTHTYSIALAILFFDRLGDPGDVPLIESLTVRLLAGQTGSGGWDYQCPSIGDDEILRLQATVAQRKELVGRRGPPRAGDGKRTLKDLPREIQHQLATLNRVGFGGRPMGSDNSNTQFATLALWVARRHGLPVEPALKRVEARFRTTQNADGGWSYFDRNSPIMRTRMGGSTASMTCAGLLGLAVADATVLEITRKNPDAPPGRDVNKDANLRHGLLALSTAIGLPQAAHHKPGSRPRIAAVGGRTYYFLWSLERVAVALDRKTIGKKDWYAWGAEILLANQQADGTWQGNFAACGADTCFALLFLKRANLAPDLTSQFTGQLPDASERTLKKGGVGGGALAATAITELKSGIEGKDDHPPSTTPEDRPNKSKDGKAIAKPREDVSGALTPLVSPVAGLADDLVQSTGSRHTLLLKHMRDGKGRLFTEALAQAMPRLIGEQQQKARAALTERLTRMKAETLANYLEDKDAEIRRAAALACANKADKALISRLIPRLRDSERGVAEAVHSALKDLSGQDFGPAADANREERDRAVSRWLDWWNKQNHTRGQKD
jgi:hypothetical protein